MGESANLEQHMALGRIGVFVFDQPLDHGDHRADMVGGARRDSGLEATQRRHVVSILGRCAGGQIGDRFLALGGALDDLVVDIGDVARIDDMARAIDRAKQPEQQSNTTTGRALPICGSS